MTCGLPLDPSPAARAPMAAAAVAFLEALRESDVASPMHVPTPAALIDAMRAAPPEAGAALEPLMRQLFDAAQCGWSKSAPGDLAFIPSGGLYSGAIAALLAAGIHAFTGAAQEVPALVALEESVLRWMTGLFGWPDDAEGLLLSGGSLANQTAVVCARERRPSAGPGAGVAPGVAYLSERAHHSLPKALHLAGIAAGEVRRIAADRQGRIDTAALEAQIARDRASGLAPWLVVGVAGSTDTGAVDPLPRLAAIAREHRAWFHVDAAYGGFFALTARGAARLDGIALADSITLDAHKGLQLPYGVGALLVREPGALARAHGGGAAYMRDVPAAQKLPHYFERGPELTRPFRGLLVWLPLHLHGVARFREALDRALDLATDAAERLQALQGIVLQHAPELSIVAFRCAAGDAATERLLQAINASGRLHVSSTELDGRIAIRLAFLHHRTGPAQVDQLIGLVRDTPR